TQKLRDTKLAWWVKSAAITEANYQASADQMFAVAEGADWRGQTTIDNEVARQKAVANAALWTVEEDKTLAATQALDTVFNIPWTHYLAAEAQAHKNWWGQQSNPTSAAGKYVQWIKDENTAQQNYTNALAADQYAEMEGNPSLGILGV